MKEPKPLIVPSGAAVGCSAWLGGKVGQYKINDVVLGIARHQKYPHQSKHLILWNLIWLLVGNVKKMANLFVKHLAFRRPLEPSKSLISIKDVTSRITALYKSVRNALHKRHGSSDVVHKGVMPPNDQAHRLPPAATVERKGKHE